VKSEKPNFDLTTLLPVIVFGPVSTPIKSAAAINPLTSSTVYSFINGVNRSTEVTFNFYSHVDVRDVARAHVLSLALPAASNQRIILSSSDAMTPQAVVNALNRNFPHLKDRIASGNPEQLFPKGVDATLFSGNKAQAIFGDGWTFRSLETTVTDVATQLLEEEKTW